MQAINSNDPFQVRNKSGTVLLKVLASGNTGIGTATPSYKLDINCQGGIGVAPAPLRIVSFSGYTDIVVTNDDKVGIGTASPAALLDVQAIGSNVPFQIKNSSATVLMKVTADGKVQIGSTAPSGTYATYKLGVDGDMVAKRVIVQTASWADNVFDNNYSLKSIDDLKNYIATNKHLPEIPTECEVADKGVDVGEMNKLLLQKVEELTLYMIAQQKQIDELKALLTK